MWSQTWDLVGAGLEEGDVSRLGVLSVHKEVSWGPGGIVGGCAGPNLIGPQSSTRMETAGSRGALKTYGAWPQLAGAAWEGSSSFMSVGPADGADPGLGQDRGPGQNQEWPVQWGMGQERDREGVRASGG